MESYIYIIINILIILILIFYISFLIQYFLIETLFERKYPQLHKKSRGGLDRIFWMGFGGFHFYLRLFNKKEFNKFFNNIFSYENILKTKDRKLIRLVNNFRGKYRVFAIISSSSAFLGLLILLLFFIIILISFISSLI